MAESFIILGDMNARNITKGSMPHLHLLHGATTEGPVAAMSKALLAVPVSTQLMHCKD